MLDVLVKDFVATAGCVGRRIVDGSVQFRFDERRFRWVFGFKLFHLSPGSDYETLREDDLLGWRRGTAGCVGGPEDGLLGASLF